MTDTELRLLKSLSQRYPTIQKASTEIINLSAILNLPKGTEHFISDIHGEYEAFTHIVNNASGVIKRKINDVFKDSLRQSEKSQLATLIYYPKEKLQHILRTEENPKEWYKITLHRLVEVCRNASGKYTRSKVRKMLPADFAYVIEELLHEHDSDVNKSEYYNSILSAIIETGRADAFIYEICVLIRRLTIDRLHIVGDIYDRGPSPDVVIDTLMQYRDVDIQWGNHDVVWMGAALGSKACIASVIRMAARYDNLAIIEDNYGINLLPLATFAIDTYGNEECLPFKPKVQTNYSESQELLVRRMHKAISIIQFKLDGQIIDNNPMFNMGHVKRMHRIDKEKGTVEIDGEIYPLKDASFPTLDPKNPYKLTEEEAAVIDRLQSTFLASEKLRKHIQYLFDKGSMYLTYNSNLLVHGCIPLNEDGSLKEVKVLDKKLKGKALFDELEKIMRRAMANANQGLPNSYELDYFWYLWQGPDSPLFGKRKMATFEMYLVEDKKTHEEEKNSYFKLRDDETVCNNILKEFGLNPEDSHIINGHTPVKFSRGENPVKANGKLIVIDGGMAKAYQPVTGIAGYTLIYNSYGLILVAHKSFESKKQAIEEEVDISTMQTILKRVASRKRVGDTDIGVELQKQIEDLEFLLKAYREGVIREQNV
ncbi:MAG TPA: fructose-1,6-bisphosphatase [Salinivirgaceae bacterium]|nr:fructose-1,6-bisphosphatase [Salinivirgaceae bacterium]HQA75963.1 fructose-1,6-bisphosphatase [Salinivirgaceae bacterium]